VLGRRTLAETSPVRLPAVARYNHDATARANTPFAPEKAMDLVQALTRSFPGRLQARATCPPTIRAANGLAPLDLLHRIFLSNLSGLFSSSEVDYLVPAVTCTGKAAAIRLFNALCCLEQHTIGRELTHCNSST
jgi:hypothetical protein